jgi:hypothetical protein
MYLCLCTINHSKLLKNYQCVKILTKINDVANVVHTFTLYFTYYQHIFLGRKI